MGADWSAVVWSGLIATTLAAAVFWLFRTFTATRFMPATALGGVVFKEAHSPVAETIGQVVFFAVHATVLAALYASLFDALGGPSVGRGALLGAAHGLVGVVLLPALGTISASVRSGLEEPPGRFGMQWGPTTPVSIVAGYVVYGSLLAAVLAGFARVQTV